MTLPQRIPIWQHLWQLLRYAPRLYLLDSFLWLFIMGLPAVPGLMIREFFDALTENRGNDSGMFRSPLIWVALLMSVGVARVVAIFTGRITKTQHRFIISALVQRNLLEKLIQKPGAAAFVVHGETVSPGEIINFFRDDTSQIEDTVVGTNEIFGAGVFAIASLFILFSVNFYLTLLVFLPLVTIAIVVRYAETHIKRYRSASRRATQRVTGLMGELFGAVQAIQIAGAENTVLHHFRQLNEQRRQRMLQDQVFTTIVNSILENLANLGTGLILLLAALFNSANNRSLSVGDFALFVYYLAFVTDFLWFMGGFLTLSKQTEVSFERIGALLGEGNESGGGTADIVVHAPLYLPDLRGRMPELPAVEQPIRDETLPLQVLKAVHLTYHYPNHQRDIHPRNVHYNIHSHDIHLCGITDISLTLPRGSITVITGRVGSGKTTLLRALLGLLPIQTGELYWNGLQVEHPDRFFVPPRSAYVPQVPQLFSNTLRENLLLGLQQGDEELKQAIVLAALDQDLDNMPEGLNTVIGSKGTRLSGGQQHRAAAARMLVRQPQLLVFDDLSSALDVETEQKLWSRLFNLKNNSSDSPTYLIVSHRPFVLQQADQIIILSGGRVQAQGKPKDLLGSE
jgi:ATP-binding cassette subfamily B protein